MLSNKSLFEEVGKIQLLSAIKKFNPNLRTAYVLNWIPEQEEDIYTILIDGELVLRVEITRHDAQSEPLVSSQPINEYKKGLSKMNQIKLAVALDLVKGDLQKYGVVKKSAV
ncbi:hypothetical protein E6C55_06500 [Cohnella fermenti]|uniref:Uncharacterized protein n=1 Tax=Cohnella fermenti TaxID=2565925 RepID=A0A4S4C4P8_9BACL|nr:hypothetical protein E6C55_06500 [Cohnella fermenti]